MTIQCINEESASLYCTSSSECSGESKILFESEFNWGDPGRNFARCSYSNWGTLIIPGLNLIFISSGALFCTVAFVSQHKLAYILPFRAIRLIAVEIEKGAPLYSYRWSKQEGLIEESYFSGMLSGLSHFAKEALGKGNIREIHLDEAILLVQRSHQFPVACVLFANKSSPSLRTALNFFADQFFHDYSNYFLAEIQDLTVYESASTLVTEFFPFVPEYE